MGNGGGGNLLGQLQKHYTRPFFVAPHALKQFRKRFNPDYSDSEIQQLLNDQLQPPKIPDGAHINMQRGDPALYYAVMIDGVPSTAVVSSPPDTDIGIPRDPDVWPVIVTIYPGRKHIAKYLKKLAVIRANKQKRKWEQWEIQSVRLMRWIGYTQSEIGQVMQMTVRQVERYTPPTKPWWTEEEIQIMCDLRSKGKTYKKIAQALGRSESAVKLKMRRHKEWVLSDPERVAFLRIMHWLRNPGKLLSHMRRTDMIAMVAKLYDEGGIPYVNSHSTDI
jgi:hypothetical protein